MLRGLHEKEERHAASARRIRAISGESAEISDALWIVLVLAAEAGA